MTIHKVRRAIELALRPGQFFVQPPLRLRIEQVDAISMPWEVFRGHLVDAALARATVTFDAWHVWLDEPAAKSPAPLVSVLVDRAASAHVVRRVLMHAFEAYEASPGVILSREVDKWIPELVGTIDGGLADDALSTELSAYVYAAIVGTSRLPITSLESPLPSFSLGQWCYVPNLPGGDEPLMDPIALMRVALAANASTAVRAKALETALRAIGRRQIGPLADVLAEFAGQHLHAADTVPALFREVFHGVALSPYTTFADRLIETLLALAEPERLGPEQVIGLISYMLRQLCRHLTAFDLSVFHNFGANYPDALFLDALLRAYGRLIDARPDFFLAQGAEAAATENQKRLRRRALRQASLVRKSYEGHRVPDAPTSMGENLRVLPPPFARVPPEQIAELSRRRRKLYEGDPLENVLSEAARRVLSESLADLQHETELRELGMAGFLDRPLGILKQPGEVDRTPLVASEAFSRSLARQRLARLKSLGWISQDERDVLAATVAAAPARGVPVAQLAAVDRPGVVSLADALKAAPDFWLLRTTRSSLDDLLSLYDWNPLADVAAETAHWLATSRSLLLVHDAPPGDRATIKLFDTSSAVALRLVLGFDPGVAAMVQYVERGVREAPERLQLLAVAHRHADGRVSLDDVADRKLWIHPSIAGNAHLKISLPRSNLQ